MHVVYLDAFCMQVLDQERFLVFLGIYTTLTGEVSCCLFLARVVCYIRLGLV